MCSLHLPCDPIPILSLLLVQRRPRCAGDLRDVHCTLVVQQVERSAAELAEAKEAVHGPGYVSVRAGLVVLDVEVDAGHSAGEGRGRGAVEGEDAGGVDDDDDRASDSAATGFIVDVGVGVGGDVVVGTGVQSSCAAR
jgi:hypothetical protein